MMTSTFFQSANTTVPNSQFFDFTPLKDEPLETVHPTPATLNPTPSLPLIRIEQISKAYKKGENVLDGVSLTISSGEIYGIIGRSGAGKSTLVRCLNGLEPPTTGRIVIDGDEITLLKGKALRQARRRIGMIFQHFNLLSSRTVSANVALPLEMAGASRNHIQQRVPELLKLVGLENKANHYPVELSGGQKQRVGIARALALDPHILLCDEVSSALDPEATEQILMLLKDINQRLGITMVMISHEMDALRDIASHLAVLERGRIVEKGAIYDVFAHPKTEVARRFVSDTVAHDLPEMIQARLNPNPQAGRNPVIRIVQAGDNVHIPVVALLQQHFNVSAHILYGRVDYIGDQPLAVMTLLLKGADTAPTSILHWLHAQQFQVEVVGYAA